MTHVIHTLFSYSFFKRSLILKGIIIFTMHILNMQHIFYYAVSCDILMSGFIFWPNGNPAAHKNIL